MRTLFVVLAVLLSAARRSTHRSVADLTLADRDHLGWLVCDHATRDGERIGIYWASASGREPSLIPPMLPRGQCPHGAQPRPLPARPDQGPEVPPPDPDTPPRRQAPRDRAAVDQSPLGPTGRPPQNSLACTSAFRIGASGAETLVNLAYRDPPPRGQSWTSRPFRLLIQEKLADGRLPHDYISRIGGGPGNGETCGGCGETVTKARMMMGARREGMWVQFYAACFHVWDVERLVPGHEPSARLPAPARSAFQGPRAGPGGRSTT